MTNFNIFVNKHLKWQNKTLKSHSSDVELQNIKQDRIFELIFDYLLFTFNLPFVNNKN